MPSTSSFYGFAFTEDLCSFHSRQTGPDLIKYSSSQLLFLGVAVAMSPPSVCCVLRNSDQVDRGENTEIFILLGTDKPPEANTKKNVRETRTGGRAPHEQKRETHAGKTRLMTA